MKKSTVIIVVLLIVASAIGTIAIAEGVKQKGGIVEKITKHSDKQVSVSVSDGLSVKEISLTTSIDGKKTDMDIYKPKVDSKASKAVYYSWSTELGDHRNGPKVYLKDVAENAIISLGVGLSPSISHNGNYVAFESVPENVKTQRPYIVVNDLTTGKSISVAYTSEKGKWKENNIVWSDDDTSFTFISYYNEYGGNPAVVKYILLTGKLEVVSR